MKSISPLLLVGVSVRMLAQSCARAGLAPIALDWFADLDTASHCQRSAAVADERVSGFDHLKLLALAREWAPSNSSCGLIYGSGLDNDPDLLQQLSTGRKIYGNALPTLRRVKSPSVFFSLLDRLAIPHPRTLLSGPQKRDSGRDWLIKHPGNEGGLGVRVHRHDTPLTAGSYLQERITGKPHSLLFLASRSDIQTIGFNRLMTIDTDGNLPFRFAGASNRTRLTTHQRRAVAGYARALARELGLVGLNSLDFLVADGDCLVLEINPRPSATMALHDADYPQGLIAAHIESCLGRLFTIKRASTRPRAFRIVFANESHTLRPGVAWPPWTADRPRAGTHFSPNDPICSVHAAGASAATMESRLDQREQLIRAALMF